MNTEKSKLLFEAAKNVIPGGVNSPVRACRSVDCDPLFIERAEGSMIYDADGNGYIDYVGSWGPMILGHGHPAVKEAIALMLEKGTSFGAPTALETKLAELIISMVPSVEMIRMVNSGTEATMSAIRLARGFTKRDKIIKFDGCYHGHADMLLVEAGSGVATAKHGALLIFDEVMTGFRVARGCAQGLFKVMPDLTCFGKIIGGGLPVGAYGGSREIMECIAPVGSVYQAGTLSGNPLAMTAGIATLKELNKPGVYEKLEKKAKKLISGIKSVASEAQIVVSGGNTGSMTGLFFTGKKVKNFDDAKTSNLNRFTAFYKGMLEKGVYLAPSQFEAGFVSTAHTDIQIDVTIEAAKEVMKSL